MNKLLIFLNVKLIKFYQYFFSPVLGNKCRYQPSCSDYYIESLNIHGFTKGTYLGIKRILTCHPIKFLGGGEGFDPVHKLKEKNNHGH